MTETGCTDRSLPERAGIEAEHGEQRRLDDVLPAAVERHPQVEAAAVVDEEVGARAEVCMKKPECETRLGALACSPAAVPHSIGA